MKPESKKILKAILGSIIVFIIVTLLTSFIKATLINPFELIQMSLLIQNKISFRVFTVFTVLFYGIYIYLYYRFVNELYNDKETKDVLEIFCYACVILSLISYISILC